MIKFLGLALVISASSPLIAQAKVAKAAKAASLQSISERYGGSNIEKRILLSECHEANLESLVDVCSKKAADLSSADVDRIKEELASSSEQEMVSSNKANINVTSGNGNQQSTVTTIVADCAAQVAQAVQTVKQSNQPAQSGQPTQTTQSTQASQNAKQIIADFNKRMSGLLGRR